MNISRDLEKRSESKCELCGNEERLTAYIVAPKTGENLEDQVSTCSTCNDQLENSDNIDPNHWRCINDSMWSQEPAVQVVAYRMLHKLKSTDWANDLIDMMYLDDDTKSWAKEGIVDESETVVHQDSNGTILEAGDTVTLIKDLKVKGASLVAKRGTAVRRIRLVRDNANHIEGKVEGQTVVILTQYVKK
ncbi:MAG: protein PhnA [Saprospiraceae bacterium]|jgi:protein PhnA|tara:strand:- start:722 stop:1291 length:570 start_codon:yes stop_codon:yes gene_type:complete